MDKYLEIMYDKLWYQLYTGITSQFRNPHILTPWLFAQCLNV